MSVGAGAVVAAVVVSEGAVVVVVGVVVGDVVVDVGDVVDVVVVVVVDVLDVVPDEPVAPGLPVDAGLPGVPPAAAETGAVSWEPVEELPPPPPQPIRAIEKSVQIVSVLFIYGSC